MVKQIQDNKDLEKAKKREWTGRSRGNLLGYWIFQKLLEVGGLRTAYFLLAIVVFYYLLFAPKGLKASRDYLERQFGKMSWWRMWLHNYRHFFNFGQVLVDRMALNMGLIDELHFTHDGREHLEAISAQEGGAILLSAHIGNWALAGHLLDQAMEKDVYVVMLEAEAAHIRRFMASLGAEPSYKIIAIQEGKGAILQIFAVLNKGAVVCLHGDRFLEGGRVVEGKLLGHEADFPVLPYFLSQTMKLPLYYFFCVKEDRFHYRFIARGPSFCEKKEDESKKEASQRWLKNYLNELEILLKKYPYQWFNFYFFWDKSEE